LFGVSLSPRPVFSYNGFVEPTIAELCSSRFEEAFGRRRQLGRLLGGSAALSVGTGKLAELSRRTVVLSLLAGAGTRWTRSVEAARAAALARGETPDPALDPGRPRGLFPVRNLLGGPRPSLPIGAYALAATAGLGRRALVVRGFEAEFEAELIRPLGAAAGEWRWATQPEIAGKPRGHGDAALRALDVWRDADYVIANFGGDAASPATAALGLLCLDALNRAGGDVASVLPAARFESPAYPIAFGPGGLPRAFGHAKLAGRELSGGPGWANVGVRVYRAADLGAVLLELADAYFEEGYGYRVPGNDPEGRELALDNVDAALASRGGVRVLAAARPSELSPVKELGDVAAFEVAEEANLRDSAALGFPAPRLG